MINTMICVETYHSTSRSKILRSSILFGGHPNEQNRPRGMLLSLFILLWLTERRKTNLKWNREMSITFCKSYKQSLKSPETVYIASHTTSMLVYLFLLIWFIHLAQFLYERHQTIKHESMYRHNDTVLKKFIIT